MSSKPITVYDKPATGGPYVEVHTLAPLSIAAYNLSFYSDYDGQVWTSVCDGMGTASNFTVNFCSNNVTLAAAILHSTHLTDAQTVAKFWVGGMNYTSCAALGSTSTTTESNGDVYWGCKWTLEFWVQCWTSRCNGGFAVEPVCSELQLWGPYIRSYYICQNKALSLPCVLQRLLGGLFYTHDK